MSNSLFRDWVPQRYKLSILLLIAVSLSFCSGIPNSIYIYIISDQAASSADLSMAMYAYCAGMVCSISLIFRLTIYMPKKRLIIFCLILLMVINLGLAINQAPLINVMLMFVFGCVKIILTMALISELMPYLMPTGERYQMYAIYYPMNLIFPILGGLIAAYLAKQHWELGYYFQTLMLLISFLIVIICFKTQHIKKVPLFQYDWLGTILLASSLLCFSFVASYGLQNNWLNSKSIIVAIVLTIVFFILFFNRNFKKKRKIISFSVIRNKATFLTLFTVFILGIFYSNTSLLSNLMNVLLPSNPTKQAEINAYVIVGYFLGSILVYIYFKQTKKCKAIFLISASLYLISNILLYNLININTPLHYLILPILLRGMAVIISFISTAVYLAGNVNGKAFLQSIVMFLLIRTFFVTVFWSSVISNWFNKLQFIHQTRLAEVIESGVKVDRTVLINFQKQANLLGLHDLYLYLCIINILVIIIIAVIPYHSSTVRHIFNWGTKKNAKELIQATPMS